MAARSPLWICNELAPLLFVIAVGSDVGAEEEEIVTVESVFVGLEVEVEVEAELSLELVVSDGKDVESDDVPVLEELRAELDTDAVAAALTVVADMIPVPVAPWTVKPGEKL